MDAIPPHGNFEDSQVPNGSPFILFIWKKQQTSCPNLPAKLLEKNLIRQLLQQSPKTPMATSQRSSTFNENPKSTFWWKKMRPPKTSPKFSPETFLLSSPKKKSTLQKFEKTSLSPSHSLFIQVTQSSPRPRPSIGRSSCHLHCHWWNSTTSVIHHSMASASWKDEGGQGPSHGCHAKEAQQAQRWHGHPWLYALCEMHHGRDQSGANQQRYNPNKKNLRSQKKVLRKIAVKDDDGQAHGEKTGLVVKSYFMFRKGNIWAN